MLFSWLCPCGPSTRMSSSRSPLSQVHTHAMGAGEARGNRENEGIGGGSRLPLTGPDTKYFRPGQPRGKISILCTYLPVVSFLGLHLEACGILVSPTRDQTLTP